MPPSFGVKTISNCGRAAVASRGLLVPLLRCADIVIPPLHEYSISCRRLFYRGTRPILRPAPTTTSSLRPKAAHLVHDLGGDIHKFGPIPISSKALQQWEHQCHSLFAVLASKQVLNTDELRRAIEDLTDVQYESWSYYEKWAAAMTRLLLEKGRITNDELRSALFGEGTINTEQDPKFRVGDAVQVAQYHQQPQGVEWRRPHIRTPGYIYGASGTVEKVCGLHGDPSFLAFGLKAPQSGQSSGHAFTNVPLLNHDADRRDCLHRHHDHSHHHNHDHHDDHSHDPRPAVEERAVRLEGPQRPGKELFSALLKILVEQKIVTLDEVRKMAEKLDTAGVELSGVTLVVKAWIDPEFSERLLKDPARAAAELGISTSNLNAPTELSVVKNTPEEHNLFVCTLCSCYPSGLLGIAPSWYKSSEFRARAVREPRSVLREFGTTIPDMQRVRVHDSTADHRYIVLPQQPAGSEGWAESELRQLITRDCMIGVSVPKVPASSAR